MWIASILTTRRSFLTVHDVTVSVCVCLTFRGSTGFGQDSIESLPGNIGRNDVDDIVLALRAVVDKINMEGDAVGTLTTQ